MTTQPPIFIITGVPGTGKSSIAIELMRRFAFGIHIPVDNLREFVVAGIAHPVPEWTSETGRQFRLARAAAAQVARLYSDAGFAVAIDDVLGPADAQASFGADLEASRVQKVLLYASLEVVLARNAQRNNKAFDTGVLQAVIEKLHAATAAEPYAAQGWLVVDTSALTLQQTVDQILEQSAPAKPAAPVDQHGVLADEVFAYRASKEKVFISWHGKQVMILKGRDAARFLNKIAGLEGKQAQLVMAKLTGNFKRGNER